MIAINVFTTNVEFYTKLEIYSVLMNEVSVSVPIGGPLEPTLYLAQLSRYKASDILLS